MRPAALLMHSVLLAAALAVIRQAHYTKLGPNGAPIDDCLLNGTFDAPPELVAHPFRFLLWCENWCGSIANCYSFCLSQKQSICVLYSSMIGLQYSGGLPKKEDVSCYSSIATIFNIIGQDTPISTNPPYSAYTLYSVESMKDHIYNPCLSADAQSYHTQAAPSPWVRFDFGKEETVEQIYVTANMFELIDIRLGNNPANTANPVIYHVATTPANPYNTEFRVPLTQLHKGRYLSFNSLDGDSGAYVEIGEVRVLRAFG